MMSREARYAVGRSKTDRKNDRMHDMESSVRGGMGGQHVMLKVSHGTPPAAFLWGTSCRRPVMKEPPSPDAWPLLGGSAHCRLRFSPFRKAGARGGFKPCNLQKLSSWHGPENPP